MDLNILFLVFMNLKPDDRRTEAQWATISRVRCSRPLLGASLLFTSPSQFALAAGLSRSATATTFQRYLNTFEPQKHCPRVCNSGAADCIGPVNTKGNSYYLVSELPSSELDFTLRITLKAASDAYIAFSVSDQFGTGADETYQVELGGAGNTKSCIRNQIAMDCLAEKTHKLPLLKKNKDLKFTITRTGAKLSVKDSAGQLVVSYAGGPFLLERQPCSLNPWRLRRHSCKIHRDSNR